MDSNVACNASTGKSSFAALSHEEPFWTRELARLSGGKFDADIVPFDRAGVPAGDMLRLIQLGVVPFGTTQMSSLSAPFPQYTAADLAGLNPDMASLKKNVAAFRPYLEKHCAAVMESSRWPCLSIRPRSCSAPNP